MQLILLLFSFWSNSIYSFPFQKKQIGKRLEIFWILDKQQPLSISDLSYIGETDSDGCNYDKWNSMLASGKPKHVNKLDQANLAS